jgi:L-lactate dehydrogenase complex protein LldF
MPHKPKDIFIEKSENKAFSAQHRQRISFNMSKYDAKVAEGKAQFADLEAARTAAKNIKADTVAHLGEYLRQFEQHFTSRKGNTLIWAEDVAQAQKAVAEIVARHEARTVVKSKSMLSEEIHLNDFLAQLGVETLETDLGEYIVQLRNEPPYHIVTPAMHLSRHDIADLFTQRFGLPPNSSPEYITDFVRQQLRQQFLTADIGITGANFLLADTGSILITENEGNARLATSLPKIHIAIAGIERVLPRLADLDLFLPLLATYGTGQPLTVYNTIINGAKQADEADGAAFMYLILVDNGRSRMQQDPVLRQALACIRCGACLNACPVYRNIGGHTYDAPYTGPIGAVIMPHLGSQTTQNIDFQQNIHLSNASSLCSACHSACPVKIDLPSLLLYNRHLETQRGYKTRKESRLWIWWRRVMLRRSWLNLPQWLKRLSIAWFSRSAWGERRNFPSLPKQSFQQLWRKNEI